MGVAERLNEILAIIPARGGSKGVPRKNIRMLGGKPLIAYSIELARRVPGIGRVVVSTEDEEIAQVAKEWGAETPFLRPGHLADDNSNVGQACSYTLRRLEEKEAYSPVGWCILFPTHPFRKTGTVAGLVDKLLAGHQGVNTFTTIEAHALSFLRVIPGGLEQLRDKGARLEGRRYLFPTGYFIGKSQFPAHRRLGEYVHCLDDPMEMLDIDYMHDFYFAEEIVNAGLYGAES